MSKPNAACGWLTGLRGRQRSRILLAFSILGACSLIAPLGRTEPASQTSLRTEAGSRNVSIDELRKRYEGTYRYVGSAREQKAREDAIQRSVSTFFFAIQGIVRLKIEERTRIVDNCTFEFQDGYIRSTVPGHPVALSPDSGAPADYRLNSDAIALSQRFEGKHLVQTFTTDDGGSRRNEFTQSEDGHFLYMRATVTSPRLQIPIVYTLTYARIGPP